MLAERLVNMKEMEPMHLVDRLWGDVHHKNISPQVQLLILPGSKMWGGNILVPRKLEVLKLPSHLTQEEIFKVNDQSTESQRIVTWQAFILEPTHWFKTVKNHTRSHVTCDFLLIWNHRISFIDVLEIRYGCVIQVILMKHKSIHNNYRLFQMFERSNESSMICSIVHRYHWWLITLWK